MKTLSRAAWIFTVCLSWGLSWGQGTFSETVTLHVSFGCDADSTYEIWLYDDIVPPKEWQDAQDFAASRDLRGETGHLATFEDAAEETCVLTQAAGLGLGTNQQLWIGLVQDSGGAEPAGGWGWVTEEDFSSHVNWAGNEPNNAGGSENHGTIGRFGYGINDGWNDEDPTRGSLYGMVIEYDVAALGEIVLDCEVGEPCEIQIPSANPDSNTIMLPTGAGGTADVGVFLIEENCADLNGEEIYDSRDVPFGLSGDTIPVANYLCADQWILVSSELDFDILSGVVEAELEAADFGLVPKYCAGSDDNPIPLADPLKTDLVTYLPDSKLWEVDTDFPRSDNWMQDFTYACGSSRGRMAGNRYFGIGLNFYFKGESFAGDPDGIKTQLILLTRQKLVRMLEWVADARMRKVIKQGDFRKMEEKIEGAIINIDQMEFDQARQRIADLFGKFLDAATFKVANASGHNFQGEGIARSSNVLHMLDVYLILIAQ